MKRRCRDKVGVTQWEDSPREYALRRAVQSIEAGLDPVGFGSAVVIGKEHGLVSCLSKAFVGSKAGAPAGGSDVAHSSRLEFGRYLGHCIFIALVDHENFIWARGSPCESPQGQGQLSRPADGRDDH